MTICMTSFVVMTIVVFINTIYYLSTTSITTGIIMQQQVSRKHLYPQDIFYLKLTSSTHVHLLFSSDFQIIRLLNYKFQIKKHNLCM